MYKGWKKKKKVLKNIPIVLRVVVVVQHNIIHYTE